MNLVTDTLTGELLYIFAVSILDAAIVSWMALRLYRRSVLRFMKAPAGAAAEDDVAPALERSTAADSPAPGLLGPSVQSVRAGRRVALPPASRRLAVAYLVGTLVYSGIVTIPRVYEIWPVSPGGIAAILWVNLWPIVPALGLLLVLSWTGTLRLGGLFLLCGSLVVMLVTFAGQIARGTFNSAPFTNVYWANTLLLATAYLPALVLLFISWRRIRAVVAMTLAATLFFGLGLPFFRRAVVAIFEADALGALMLAFAGGTTPHAAFYSIYMLVALPVGWFGWRVLRRLAVAFERKAFSDIQLVVDCWFAIVTMELIAMQLAGPFGLRGIAIGLFAFAFYRATVEMMLRVKPLVIPAEPEDAIKRLLLLRVFGHQSRTERLFDYIAQHWRFRGPVQLIAGADLAMRTIDPGDVLAFVSGRLRNQYVASPDEIPARIERLDMRPDPDGRFRVNELYCLHDTWKATLQALLTVTDAVVMDVRGFSRKSRGVLYELQEIVTKISTERIVLIADHATDEQLLEETLGRAWTQVSHPSGAARPIVLVKVNRNSRRELGAVMNHLLRLGEPGHA